MEDLTPKYNHKTAKELFQDMESPFGRSIAETFGGLRGHGASFTRGKGDKVFKGDHQGIWLGNADFSSAPFSVDMDGNLVATSATISGNISASTIDIGGSDSTSFHVDVDGNMWLGAATFASAPAKISNAGVLTLSGTSSSVSIGSGNSIFKADSNGIYLGNATFASAPFRVTPAGALTATSATITGTVNATAGTFSGSITVSGSLTGGTIRTSASGQRVEITGSNDRITFYDGNGTAEGFIYGSTVGGGTLVVDADIVLFDNNSFIQATGVRPNGSSDDLGTSGSNWDVVYANKISRGSDVNVIDMSLTGNIAINQPFRFAAKTSDPTGLGGLVYWDSVNGRLRVYDDVAATWKTIQAI